MAQISEDNTDCSTQRTHTNTYPARLYKEDRRTEILIMQCAGSEMVNSAAEHLIAEKHDRCCQLLVVMRPSNRGWLAGRAVGQRVTSSRI